MSIVDVCNQALMRIGAAAIRSIDEASNEARLCRLAWAATRDRVLRLHPWPWATRRVLLAALPVPPVQWAYTYAMPTDCLQFRRILLPGLRVPLPAQAPAFEVGPGCVYSDQPDAVGEYTARVEEPDTWDALALDALAWALAAEIAMALTAKPDLANAARQAFMQAMSAAQAVSLGEQHIGPEPTGEFLAARGIGA